MDVHEFAEVLLSPCFGIVEGGLEFGRIEGKAAADGVVNCDFGGVENRRIAFAVGIPELRETVVESVGCGDDAEFFDTAPEWIGNGGIDCAPE